MDPLAPLREQMRLSLEQIAEADAKKQAQNTPLELGPFYSSLNIDVSEFSSEPSSKASLQLTVAELMLESRQAHGSACVLREEVDHFAQAVELHKGKVREIIQEHGDFDKDEIQSIEELVNFLLHLKPEEVQTDLEQSEHSALAAPEAIADSSEHSLTETQISEEQVNLKQQSNRQKLLLQAYQQTYPVLEVLIDGQHVHIKTCTKYHPKGQFVVRTSPSMKASFWVQKNNVKTEIRVEDSEQQTSFEAAWANAKGFQGKFKKTEATGQIVTGTLENSAWVNDNALVAKIVTQGKLRDGLLEGEGCQTVPGVWKRKGTFRAGELVNGTYEGFQDEAELLIQFKNKKPTTGTIKRRNSTYTGPVNTFYQEHGKGQKTFTNGAIHNGTFVDGDFIEGTYKTPEFEYVGKFEDGYCSGKGTLKSFTLKTEYKGDFQQGAFHGQGTLTDSTGVRTGTFENGVFVRGQVKQGELVYEGPIRNGQPHGLGRSEVKNRYFYEGEFMDGVRSGQGKLTQAKGPTLEGSFENGNFVKGVVTTATYTYEGEVNGKAQFHGYGKLTQHGKSVYEGYFEDGVKAGHGTLTQTNGTALSGTFVKGVFVEGQVTNPKYTYQGPVNARMQFHGYGKLSIPEAYEYEGQFIDGKECGEGKLTRSNGTECTGTFENGLLIKGKMVTPSFTYEGEFNANGEFHGPGTYQSTSQTMTGVFENGKFASE